MKSYPCSLYSIWPSRISVPGTNTTAAIVGRSAGAQAGYQVIALIVTLAVSIVGGIITGSVMFISPFFFYVSAWHLKVGFGTLRSSAYRSNDLDFSSVGLGVVIAFCSSRYRSSVIV